MSSTAPEPAPAPAHGVSKPRLTLDGLKALGAQLPGSHRVETGAVADVLSAVTAVIIHGTPILEASEEGGRAILEYLHSYAEKIAASEGAPPPDKGLALTSPAAPAAPAASKVDRLENTVTQLATKFDSLVGMLEKLVPAQQEAPVATEATDSTEGPHYINE